ncbi:adenine deaminase [Salinithrix halophila]|uniref:Adenine deaminase n=1 Tax=Salinithrix halophila TaxID=1485204 RepID=A0ABV8JFT7_9BACL
MNIPLLQKRIAVAAGREPADLVIKNGRIIDVFNARIIKGDVAITDGTFAGIGSYEGKENIDAGGRWICPGLIEGHAHIESSMVTPEVFARTVLPHGVTSMIADPHEIGNVAGTTGIRYMLESSEDLPMDIFFMLPSSVPATPWEHNGGVLEAEDLQPLYSHPRVLGLGEVMDYPSVRDGKKDMLKKLAGAVDTAGARIDGHGAGLDESGINVYMSAGIRTDHECVTPPEAEARLARGMYLMIREGSVAKNLDALLPVVNERNSRRCLLVTDDKHLDDLESEGSVNHCIRLAVQRGLDPLTAVQMATLNTAECFGLQTKGAVAPGYDADFLLLDSLEDFRVNRVYKNGRLVARQGEPLEGAFPQESFPVPEALSQSVRLPKLTKQDLALPLSGSHARVIGIIPDSLVTEHLTEKVAVDNGLFFPDTENDLLKLAVVERHRGKGRVGLGIVRGFGIRKGAIASTVAHDSHNLILAGADDLSMLTAAHAVEKVGGGLAVAAGSEVLAVLPLPIAGLLSDRNVPDVLSGLKEIDTALGQIGASTENPFLTLSFLALPVIPHLKLTDGGLFDVDRFCFISPETE